MTQLNKDTIPYIMTSEEYDAVEFLLSISFLSNSVMVFQDAERGDYFKDYELNCELSLADGLDLYWQEGSNSTLEDEDGNFFDKEQKILDELFDKVDPDHTVPFDVREKKYKKINGVKRLSTSDKNLKKLENEQKKVKAVKKQSNQKKSLPKGER